MKLLLSAPTGYNAREILLPLHDQLTSDSSFSEIYVLTPAAPYQQQLFPTFNNKFIFYENPADLAAHIQLFTKLKPDIILTPTVGLDTKDVAIIQAAKQLNIPSITFIASWDNIFKMERLHDRGYSGADKQTTLSFQLPDYFAVWNNLNKQHLLTSFPEISPDHIQITGPPRFDYFYHSNHIPSRSDLMQYLDFPEESFDNRLIHCATTKLYPFKYIIKSIAKARDNQEFKFPISLYASVHPGGDINKHLSYKQYGVKIKYSFGRRHNSPLPEFNYLPTSDEIYYLIALFKYTNILINQSSTVAIESMAANVPIINITYGKPFDWWGWRRSMVYRDFQQHYRYITEEGGTSLVNSPHSLIETINTYINDPTFKEAERKKTIQKMITFTDGSCTQRLLNYLKQIARI